jgi:hypothetical protein
MFKSLKCVLAFRLLLFHLPIESSGTVSSIESSGQRWIQNFRTLKHITYSAHSNRVPLNSNYKNGNKLFLFSLPSRFLLDQLLEVSNPSFLVLESCVSLFNKWIWPWSDQKQTTFPESEDLPAVKQSSFNRIVKKIAIAAYDFERDVKVSNIDQGVANLLSKRAKN